MINQPGFLTLPDHPGLDTSPVVCVRERLAEVSREAEGYEVQPLDEVLVDPERNGEQKRDGLSTRLMEVFRLHRSRAAFGLLYELNGQHLLQQVIGRLRRYQSKADPSDVLQEVFVNIYRYPHRFNCAREDAFRVWSAMIVRKAVELCPVKFQP